MVQTNIGIVLPFMLSSQRYGLLWDVYSKMRFTDDAQGARFGPTARPPGPTTTWSPARTWMP